MIILIDDDLLMHMGWKLKASKSNTELRCYQSIQLFIDDSTELPKDILIYVDSDLGNTLKGEIESKALYDIGFTKIYISTGYSPEDFDLKKYPWIKGIINKTPPF